jgi:hypothetical protein
MSLAATMTKVTAAAEEAGEEVEGVVVLARTAAFSVLLDTVVAVFVIDLASFFVDEDLVGIGYGDELLRCFVIATTWSQLLCRLGRDIAYGFLSGWYFLLRFR